MRGAEKKAELATADIARVMKLLPHRYPFLLIDRIRDMDRDESCVGIKNVTINEPFFQGHFPRYPVMPGVLIIEALAQTAGALCVHNAGKEDIPQIVYFMGIDRVRYRRPVVAGDQVILEGEVIRMRSKIGSLRGRALVDGKIACEGEMTFALGDRPGTA